VITHHAVFSWLALDKPAPNIESEQLYSRCTPTPNPTTLPPALCNHHMPTSKEDSNGINTFIDNVRQVFSGHLGSEHRSSTNPITPPPTSSPPSGQADTECQINFPPGFNPKGRITKPLHGPTKNPDQQKKKTVQQTKETVQQTEETVQQTEETVQQTKETVRQTKKPDQQTRKPVQGQKRNPVHSQTTNKSGGSPSSGGSAASASARN